MKFQGTAGAKKGPENGLIAAAPAVAFWPPRDPVFVPVFVAGTELCELACGSRALSDSDHDVAHRLAGFHRFMRRHDGAEIEALRHVVEELAALEHARDVGGRAARAPPRHQRHP